MKLGLLRQPDPHYKTTYYTPVFNDRRFQHTYVIGKTGTGKSTFLERTFLDDVYNGEGCCFIDPHGSSIETILERIPPRRINDVVLLDLADKNYPFGFNILHNVRVDDRPFIASTCVDTFKTIFGYGNFPTPDIEQFIYMGVAALLDFPGGSLLGLKFLLSPERNQRYRKRAISHIKDPIVKDFWKRDFEKNFTDRDKKEKTQSTLNKIRTLVADPTIRNVVGQSKSTISLKDIMDKGQILLVSLPKGQLGLRKSNLIGSLLLSRLYLTALQRSTDSYGFYVYVDEFPTFTGTDYAQMLSEVRKFKVSFTLPHQFIGQLEKVDRHLFPAIIGNVGTLVSFSIGVLDAKVLSDQFSLNNHDTPLHELPDFTARVRCGKRNHELEMPPLEFTVYADNPRIIRNLSRYWYARPRAVVDDKISRFISNT